MGRYWKYGTKFAARKNENHPLRSRDAKPRKATVRFMTACAQEDPQRQVRRGEEQTHDGRKVQNRQACECKQGLKEMGVQSVLTRAVDQQRLALGDRDHRVKHGVEMSSTGVKRSVVLEAGQERQDRQTDGGDVQRRPDPAPAAEGPTAARQRRGQQRDGQQRGDEEQVEAQVQVFVRQQGQPGEDGQRDCECDFHAPGQAGRGRQSASPAAANERQSEEARGEEDDARQVGQPLARFGMALVGVDEVPGDDRSLGGRDADGGVQPQGQRQEEQHRRRDAAGFLGHIASHPPPRRLVRTPGYPRRPGSCQGEPGRPRRQIG